MATTEKRIDDYIAKASDFAKPILLHFRKLVHEAVPQVEEKIKWGFPHFDYKGQMMCSIASFKNHASIGFWKASLMKDSHKLFTLEDRDGMGHLGKISRLEDLPMDDVLIDYFREAAKLNEQGIKLPSRVKATGNKEVEVPVYLSEALKKNAEAQRQFENFTPGKRKEYIQWLEEAKTKDTRDKRLETAVGWIAEGKSRNWKYEKK